MTQVRPDADHVEVQPAEQFNVVGQIIVRLAGNADHHPAADLVAQPSQRGKNRQPIVRRHAPREVVAMPSRGP